MITENWMHPAGMYVAGRRYFGQMLGKVALRQLNGIHGLDGKNLQTAIEAEWRLFFSLICTYAL